MDNSWVTQIEQNVADYIDAELEDIFVTTEQYTGDTASFPAVYVHELSQIEKGYDLDGSEIAAVMSTFEIQVFDSSYNSCKELSKQVMLLMKELRFEVIASPLHTQANGYYRSVSRYRRNISGGDSDIINEE